MPTEDLSYKDVGETLTEDFVKKAFVPEKKSGSGWQPWFVHEKPIT